MNRPVLALGLTTFLTSPAFADTLTFLGGDFFDASWENSAGAVVAPQNGDDLINANPVDPDFGGIVPFFAGEVPGATFNSVEIGSDASLGTGTPAALWVVNGNLVADRAGAGTADATEGEIFVDGGRLTARELDLGAEGFGRLVIGEFAPGLVEVTEKLTLGASNGTGSIEIGPEGDLFVYSTTDASGFPQGGLIVGATDSFIAPSNVVQNGGGSFLWRMVIAGDPDGFGSGEGLYTINAGTAVITDGEIGYDGEGAFIQNGGDVTFGSLLMGNVGSQIGSFGTARGKGTYDLNAGTLEITNGARIGGFGQATFTQTGGVNEVALNPSGGSGALIIGANEAPRNGPVPGPNDRFGRYDMDGGALVTGGDVILGAGAINPRLAAGGLGFFDQSAGTVDIGGDLIIGQRPPEIVIPSVFRNAGGEGVYTKTGGDLLVRGDMVLGEFGEPGMFTARGAFGQTGGATTVLGNIVAENNVDFAIGAGTTVNASAASFGGGTQAADLILAGPGSTLGLDGRLFVGQNGRVGGIGLIRGSVQVANLGILGPGLSPGTLSIDGDLTLEAGSILDLEFAGTGFGQFDRLVVSGNLFATGPISMRVSLLDGFLPTATDIFDILDVGGLIDFGGFDPLVEIVGGPAGLSSFFDVTAGDGTIGFRDTGTPLDPVPLPAGIWLLLAGLGGLALAGRRQAA